LLLDHPLVAKGWSIAEDGFPPTSLCPKGQPKPVMQIFCRRSHGSINKAAAVTGIGRRNVIDLAAPGEDILQVGMDLDELETKLRQSQAEGIARIVVVGLGEVNTVSSAASVPAIAGSDLRLAISGILRPRYTSHIRFV
jgi:hypothetical protein